MPSEFPHLFQPLTIGNVEVENRLMVTSHSHDLYRFDPEGYGRWNMLSDRAGVYHADRAKGGWGLVITGQTLVHKSCGTTRPLGYLEEVIEPYSRIAKSHPGRRRHVLHADESQRSRPHQRDRRLGAGHGCLVGNPRLPECRRRDL